MALKGPVILKFSEVPGKYPSVVKGPTFVAENGITGDFGYPALFNELIANCNDGRVWLRKRLPNYDELVKNPLSYYKHNYEQIGGPYVIIEKTGGHTFTAEDSGRILLINNGTTANINIPSYTGPNFVDFIVGTHIMLIQGTTQPIYISGATGVTIDVKNNSYTFDIQNGFIQCLKIAQDRWLITGDRDTAGLASQESLNILLDDILSLEASLINFGVNGYGGGSWSP